jgi:hypothetical protein
MVRIPRRAALLLPVLLPLVAAACAGSPPARTSFPPLVYDYLNPIGLNVATVDAEVRATPDVEVPSPIDAVGTLLRMGRDRLKAYGTAGRAVFAVTEVSLVQRAGGIEGTFGVELDIYTSTNTRAAYAEARVYRRTEPDGEDLRGAVYDLERQLMEAMNVELEFQVRRSLKAWVAAAPGASVPAPVEQQALPAPGSPAAPPPTPPGAPAGSPPMLNLAPPAPAPVLPPPAPAPGY